MNFNSKSLETEHLEIGFKKKNQQISLAKQINLSLYYGELVCLLGGNASGKSVLIKTLAKKNPALNGFIHIADQSIDEMSNKEFEKLINFTEFDQKSFKKLTVENFLKVKSLNNEDYRNGQPEKDLKKFLIPGFDLEENKNKKIIDLSEGEFQKVCIQRVLNQAALISIFDSLSSSLDISSKTEIINFLKSWVQSHNKTIIISTHDLDLALKLADRIWLMDSNQKILEGTPEDLMLEGKIKEAFAKENFDFDSHTGAIKYKLNNSGTVSVKGEGEMVYWTTRALERVGFEVTQSEDEDLKVSVVERDKKIFWDLQFKDRKHVCTSIRDMLGDIKTLNSMSLEHSI